MTDQTEIHGMGEAPREDHAVYIMEGVTLKNCVWFHGEGEPLSCSADHPPCQIIAPREHHEPDWLPGEPMPGTGFIFAYIISAAVGVLWLTVFLVLQ